jgi:hypothetical protein
VQKAASVAAAAASDENPAEVKTGGADSTMGAGAVEEAVEEAAEDMNGYAVGGVRSDHGYC